MSNKSLKFSMVVGINEGYGHNNEKYNALELVGYAWQDTAKKVFEKTGVYVSATIVEGKTVYNEEWGCPVGGEITAICFGSANFLFVKDLNTWKEVVIEIAENLKKDFKQSSITIEFNEIDCIYLN